jgi:hypothetical protein
MPVNMSKRRFSLLVVLLLAVVLIAPPAECVETLPTEDRELQLIPNPITKELKMLAQVKDRNKLDILYLASSVEENNTVTNFITEMNAKGATTLKIKAEGIPIAATNSFLGLPFGLGYMLSRISRFLWTGKIMTFVLNDDGSLGGSLDNAVIGFLEVLSADVYISSLQEAQEKRGEPVIDDSVAAFLFPIQKRVAVDTEQSLVLDYKTSGFFMVRGVLDLLRPVTKETLTLAGIDIPDGVENTEDLWIGQSTIAWGLFRRSRRFVCYFALHFDRDTAEFS